MRVREFVHASTEAYGMHRNRETEEKKGREENGRKRKRERGEC